MAVDVLALYAAGGGIEASGPIRSGSTRLGRADRRGDLVLFYGPSDSRVGSAERTGSLVVVRDTTGRIVLRVQS